MHYLRCQHSLHAYQSKFFIKTISLTKLKSQTNMTSTQMSESSLLHNYQSLHQSTNIRVISSIQMSESSRVQRCRISKSKSVQSQIPRLSPIHRSQSHHQNTDIRGKTLQRCQIHDQYADVRQSHHFNTVISVITFKQISESTTVLYTDVRVFTRHKLFYREKQLSLIPTSSRILKYTLYICSLCTMENAPLAGNFT